MVSSRPWPESNGVSLDGDNPHVYISSFPCGQRMIDFRREGRKGGQPKGASPMIALDDLDRILEHCGFNRNTKVLDCVPVPVLAAFSHTSVTRHDVDWSIPCVNPLCSQTGGWTADERAPGDTGSMAVNRAPRVLEHQDMSAQSGQY
jgi:hypothetical protein